MTQQAVAATRLAGSFRSAFISALAAMLLLQAAWMLTLPMFRGPDEVEHLLRASDVALGNWRPAENAGEDLLVQADAKLASRAEDTCRILREDFDPSVCLPVRSNPDGTVEVRSTAALYNPAWYSIAGLPLRLIDGAPALWLVRVTGGLLAAVMLAWAWALTTSNRRTRWPSVALLAALTPAITFATSVAAPNGAGFAAGVLLWSGLLGSVRGGRPDAAAAATGVGGVVLVLAHTTGVLWLGSAVLIVLALIGWDGLRLVLSQARRAWVVSICAVTLAVFGSGAWALLHAATAPRSGELLVAETKSIPMVAHTVLWLFQTIGVMPNRFGLLWPVVYALGLIPITLLLILGFRSGARRDRWAFALAAGVAVLVPAAATVATYDLVGVAWQGRYELPLLVGIVMIAGDLLDRRGDSVRLPVMIAISILVVVTHLLCLLCLGLREAVGPYDDGRPWGPLLVVVVPLLTLCSYAVLLFPRQRHLEIDLRLT